METYCSTGENPQRAVAPTEEEEEEVCNITIHNYILLLQYAKPEADSAVLGF
jgi:hypothetical protein